MTKLILTIFLALTVVLSACHNQKASDRLTTSYQTVGHGGTDFVYGILTGYPCCTANMHQSWPKFVQNLFYATHDGGVAALRYAPSEVNMKVGNNVNLKIKEETAYPFHDEVLFTLEPDEKTAFPFHLRIPDWANDIEITVNGVLWNENVTNSVAIINREWKKGDQVKIKMPMSLRAAQWFDYTLAIERGPLVYALKIETSVVEKNKDERFGGYKELYAASDWNYALYTKDLQNLPGSAQIIEKDWGGNRYPWNLENAPIELKMRGVKIPEWKAVNGVPFFPAWWGSRDEDKTEFEEITLVPYGCTELRITEFPVYGLR